MLNIDRLHVALDADAGLVRALDGVSLSMQRGETFALVGESGCGKSMTALAIMRLLPENGRVTDGRIELDGLDTLALPERRMRQLRGGRIGMIFQEPSTSLNPVLTVGRQLVEAIEAHTPLRGAKARAKAVEWLARVGIPEPSRRLDDYPFRMSGGQKQRAMIAMTLATEPDFLVADEPTTALDATIQKQILDLLRELQREQGLGMLFITHDLGVVAEIAHRVGLMYAGQIVEVAEAGAFFRAPAHPYARALLGALPERAAGGAALAAITGSVPSLTKAFDGCRFAPRCTSAVSACSRTVPALVPLAGDRSVRCLLYRAQDRPVAAAPAAPALPAAPAVGHPPASAEPAALLEVRGLHVLYPLHGGLLRRRGGGFEAVGGVSFDLRQGQTLALVGESGCGKTTTGKAIAQLLRRTATVSGDVRLAGTDLLALRGAALRAARRQVQIVFQDPFASLDPRMRVLDILEEGLVALCPELDASARAGRIEVLRDRVGLAREALGRYPHEFSGGQRQRIAIARALAVRPRLLVCDEPTSALDVSVQAQILNLLRELQRELGLSYLLITHNIGVVGYIADRVAVMQGGRIVEEGAAAELLGRPQHAYTRSLLAAVPRAVTA